MAAGRVSLVAAIQGLRNDVMEAIEAGDGSSVRFEVVAPIELTVEAEVTTTGEGKVSWWVLETGVKRDQRAAVTVKLTLTPRVTTREGGRPITTLLEGDGESPPVEAGPVSPDLLEG